MQKLCYHGITPKVESNTFGNTGKEAAMARPISVKIPDELLKLIGQAQKQSSMSRHAVILRLIALGFKYKRVSNQITFEKQAQGEKVRLARKNGIITGALWATVITSILLVVLQAVITRW